MRHKLLSAPLALLTLVALTLAGCGSVPLKRPRDSQVPPSIDRDATEATLMANYLDTCLKVARGTPAEQAEVLATVSNDYHAAPAPSKVLRYAMVLSTPGHSGFDPVVAQRLLREVLASPETLMPAERALAFLQLQQVERHQSLQADVRRLQTGAERTASERIAQLTRRLTTESDENSRLKKALADAQAKLDAIANIERSSGNGRPTQPEGRKP
jgi:predicted small lipoprotein YifL